MITIIVGGPQGVGKTTRIAKMFREALTHAGFVNFRIFTTNEAVVVPEGAREEKEIYDPYD